MHKVLAAVGLSVATFISLPAIAFAHVVVKPAEVGVGSFTTYTIGVPNEKEIPVTGLRLAVPSNLKYVTPSVHTGWTIDTKKSGDTVTEISWTGGEVPAGQRDDFTFSAQAPATNGSIEWKAYQTYQDGTIVSWDQAGGEDSEKEDSNSGPFSVTKVVNDLDDTSSATSNTESSKSSSSTTTTLALGAALVAVIISVVTLIRRPKA